MGRYLFLLESPMQVLNAYECIHFFGLNDWRLIVRISGEANRIQIRKLILHLFGEDERIAFVHIRAKGRGLSDVCKIVGYSFWVWFNQFRFERLVIGDYYSAFLRLARYFVPDRKLLVVDDGNTTLTMQKAFSDKKAIDLFTMYDLPAYFPQTVVKNTYKQFQAMVNKRLFIDASQTLFLGSPLSDYIYEPDDYITMVKKIAGTFPDTVFYYVPHRKEDPEILAKLEAAIPSMVQKKLDYPVEFLGIYETHLPKKVLSLYSTALVTLNIIYPMLDYQAYRFNLDCVKSADLVSGIQDAYQDLEDRIGVVDLAGIPA